MRIENRQRIGTVGGRGASPRSGSAPAFHVDGGGLADHAAATLGPSAAGSIDALLALQAVADPASRRRKQVRRASALLDALEEVKADLLVGRASDTRLDQLTVLVGEGRERDDPDLDALVDDIELRVRVELAKRGVYPPS